MPHGLSSPSVGTVKSTSVVGWPTVSTRAKFGRSWVKGPEQQALLLHRREVLAVDPDQVDRAAFGPARRLLGAAPGLTASPVSVSLTWTSSTPNRRCTSWPAQAI